MSEEINEGLRDVAMADLDRAGEHLYVAALRYVRAFERDELDHEHDESKLGMGTAAGLLGEASGRWGEAYKVADDAGCFADEDDDQAAG